MRIFILSICTLLLSCNNPDTQEKVDTLTPEEQEIAKNLIQGAFDDLWAGLDSTKILDYHTEDFIILEHGEIWDNDRITQYMRESLQRENRPKRLNYMDYISIDKYGSSIQLAYHNRAEFFQQDSLVFEGSWLESALAVKTSDGWRLKMMHSTRNKRK